MGKNILIIGNGFDLAHSLPTRYGQFLEFAHKVQIIYTFNGDYKKYEALHLNNWDGCDFLKKELKSAFDVRKRNTFISEEGLGCEVYNINERLDLLNDFLNNNIWYGYMYSLHSKGYIKGENWIDFESEISEIIQFIDRQHKSINQSFRGIKNLMIKPNAGNGKIKLFAEKSIGCLNGRDEANFSLREFREVLYED